MPHARPPGQWVLGEGDLNPGSPQTPSALMPGPWAWAPRVRPAWGQCLENSPHTGVTSVSG